MDLIVQEHSIAFFSGYLENRISVLVNAAILWSEWNDTIGKLEANIESCFGSKDVADYARVLYQPLVNWKSNSLSGYVKYDQSLVTNGKISNDPYSHLLLIMRFKRFYDSKVVKAAVFTNQLSVCIFTTNTKYMTRLKRYLATVIQISSDMEFMRQASTCDILVTPDHIDIATAFFLKPKSMILGLNADEKWAQKIRSFWNIKVYTQAINFSSKTSLVSLGNFVNMLKTANENKYLMFMPWEQLNNQLIGFKAACAMAKILDRILVLPFLGYRTNNQWNFTFNHKDYLWSPMENYFAFVDLPCRIISLSNFKTLYGKNIGQVHFNPVAKATSHQQLVDYYRDILGLHFTKVINHYKMSQLRDETVLKLFGEDKSNVLSFGSLFWAYGFNLTQDYPLKEYVSYMHNDLYRRITKGIIVKPKIAAFSIKSIKNRIGTKSLFSVHIRRGDYWNKCRAISDLAIQSHCYPSIENIKKQIRSAIESSNSLSHNNPQIDLYKSVWDQGSHYIYISTNLNSDRSELNELLREFNVLFFEDMHDMKEIEILNFDPLHMALLDRELGINSDIFIGNFYSSFSRTIIEGRELLNRTFITF